MAEAKKSGVSATYYLVLGAVLVLLGGLAWGSDGNDFARILVFAGAGSFLFGAIAKAVQIGVRSSRDD